MDHLVVSEELAIALVTLPKITAADLYERCKHKLGNATLAQFRTELSRWINENKIPGYESRKGPTGGIYKKNAPKFSLPKVNVKPQVVIDHKPVADMLAAILAVQSRITATHLYQALDIPISEIEFRPLISQWLKDGTIPGYEIKMGKTGGIYKLGTDADKWVPTIGDQTEDENSTTEFSVQITSNLRISQADYRNWVIQKRSGETWQNKFYHPTLASCINSAVKHIMNSEFKLSDSTCIQLKETLVFLKGLEGRLEIQLQKIINNKII